MAPSPVRMAILMADTPLPGTQSRFGTYGGVFTDLFARATAPAPVESVLAITTFDAVANPDLAAYPSLDDLDAVLITGSRHNAFDNAPWIETLVEDARKVLASGRVRLVGICFGHQIVGRALGVPVKRNDGAWELTVTDVRLSDAGRKFFGLETMRIHQMHRDIVSSYPDGAIPLGDTDVCAVQGMLLPGKAVTVQGHPEFTEEIVREILQVRHDAHIISDEDYKFGVDRVGNPHDGVAIAKAFVGFMQGKE